VIEVISGALPTTADSHIFAPVPSGAKAWTETPMNSPAQPTSEGHEPGQENTQTCASLVARIGRGDSAAEEELAVIYFQRIFFIALARTRDRETAQDLTQETLMAVLLALRAGRIRDGEKLAAFIQGTARNLISNHVRTRVRHPECCLEEFEFCKTDLVQTLESAERQRLIRQELSRYSVTDQQILRLSLVDGYSLAQVAERLNLTHEVVRARKSRLIKKLAKKFAETCHKTH
jgi:RNA polymerase sigma-70 factor (ECF subfamily)